MKFRYNKFYFATAVIFVFAFLSLMFSYLTTAMFYPAMVLFCAGFVMLSITFLKIYKKQTIEMEQRQEMLVMERSVNDGGETYVMQDATLDKKQKRKKRRQNFDRLLPAIVCIVISAVFAYLLISTFVVKVIL